MWKKLISLNLALLILIGLLPMGMVSAAAPKSEDMGYAVFYKNDDSEESQTKTIGNFLSSNASLKLYEVVPYLTASGKVVTSYNTKSDGTGRKYTFSDTLRESFSTNENEPSALYAQWESVTDNYILYISADGTDEDGHGYTIQSGLSGTTKLLGKDAFKSTSDKQIIGWSSRPNGGFNSTYRVGEDVSITGNMVLYAIMGVNYITFHYRTDDNQNTTETRYYHWDGASFNVYGAERYSSALFAGWNSTENGDGNGFIIDGAAKDAPHELWAQYLDYPDNNSYVILDGRDYLLSNNLQKDFQTLTDSKASLPAKLANDRRVAYWSNSKWGDSRMFYPANTEVTLGNKAVLYPTVVRDDAYYAVIDGNGGYTSSGSNYSATSCYVTSAGNLNVYSFNDLDSFTKEGAALVGYKGGKTGEIYSVDADLWAAMGKEAGENHIATFTAEYASVSGMYIQYLGNGARTADGKPYYVQGGLDSSSLDEMKYEANPFIAPSGKHFLGWNTKANGYGEWLDPGEKISVVENTQLYAQWGENRITYHYVDRSGKQQERTIVSEETIRSAISDSWPIQRVFRGWNTSSDDSGTWYSVGKDIPLGLVTDLYEVWLTTPPTGYYYILSARELSDGSMAKAVPMTDETETIKLPALNRLGLGWYKGDVADVGFIDKIKDFYTPGSSLAVTSGDHIKGLQANTSIKYVQNCEPLGQERIYYSMSSGAFLQLYDAENVFDKMPTNVVFRGWTTASDGSGDVWPAGISIPTGQSYTLYAQWSSDALKPVDLTLTPSRTSLSGGGTVTFTVGGLPAGCSVDISCDHAAYHPMGSGNRFFVELPNATATYTFTASFSGDATHSAATARCVVYVTRYAASTGSSDPSISGGGWGGRDNYTVVVEKTKNGAVAISPKNASKGDTVTITVTPDAGYELDSIKVLSKNGDPINLTDKGDGRYTFKMPAGGVTVETTFTEASPQQVFSDVPIDAYYAKAVDWAVENGITTGMPGGVFGSKLPCTRAQIVTLLWRAAGSPEPKTESSFGDVLADAYYAKAVSWAVENGITDGIGNNQFAPDSACTRSQGVTFLYRAFNSPAVSGTSIFGDVATDAYYARAVSWAADSSVTDGVGDGLFGPDAACTRAQIVTFLYRTYQK